MPGFAGEGRRGSLVSRFGGCAWRLSAGGRTLGGSLPRSREKTAIPRRQLPAATTPVPNGRDSIPPDASGLRPLKDYHLTTRARFSGARRLGAICASRSSPRAICDIRSSPRAAAVGWRGRMIAKRAPTENASNPMHHNSNFQSQARLGPAADIADCCQMRFALPCLI